MMRAAVTVIILGLSAGSAWAHEDAQAHTHGEVVGVAALLAVVFVAIVMTALLGSRQRGGEQ